MSRAHEEYTPFNHAVAGHADTLLTSTTGLIVIKPTQERERDFYSKVGASLDPDFVGVWTPQFYGTLTLEGVLNDSGEVDQVSDIENAPTQEKEAIVLQNLTHSFKKPCVIDIKLGTQLWDDLASPEKVERMTKRAQETTSAETGVRLCGFQVWDSKLESFSITSKAFGEKVTSDLLYEGMDRFFPTKNSPPLPSRFDSPPTPSSNDSGIPDHLMAELLEMILYDIKQLGELTSEFEWRAVASSVLIVYEGDQDALEESLKEFRQRQAKLEQKGQEAIQEGDHEEKDQKGEDSDDDEDEEEDEEEEEDPGHTTHLVRLIDFAHTTAVPGQGPDQGFNLGMNTLINLVNNRLEKVKKQMQK